MKKTEDAGREMKDFGDLLMEAFVEVVDETAEARGLKKSEFAQKVWPKSSARSASSRWQTIRTVASRTGCPQAVLVSDAQRMADVLGAELPYLFLQASVRAKEREAAQTKAATPPKARKKQEKPVKD